MIIDDGPGVASENIQQIFMLFYQTDNTASKGNGLGLSIAKNIIEKHNGSVKAQNNLNNKGLCINICFFDACIQL